MIHLQQPALLFGKQKVYQLSGNVEKKTANETAPQKFRAVVLFENAVEELPVTTNEMLSKLIIACKFSEEETLLLNQKYARSSIGYLQSCYEPELILIFGEMQVSKNILKLKKNFPFEISGTKILQTDSLEHLVKNESSKTTLWKILKPMLGI